MDSIADGLDEVTDGMAADIAMRFKEVTLIALDRTTREVKRLSESVPKVDEQQTCFEFGLKLGAVPTEGHIQVLLRSSEECLLTSRSK